MITLLINKMIIDPNLPGYLMKYLNNLIKFLHYFFNILFNV